jgi:hypothetical protein
MKSREATRKGKLVAQVLSGSWRRSGTAPLEISEPELEAVTPLLYDSGTAALGWRRISTTPLLTSSSAEVLHHAYRLLSLLSEIHEQKVEKVFRLLRHAQVDAVLAKGWASAGSYYDRALRPYGDIDLCVRPEQFAAAEAVLGTPDAQDCWVDLHRHFSEIDERKVEDLFARSRTVSLGEEQIRILGLEDQFALSSIHLLKHGAWRPLWLCDIGVAVESLPPTFDWDVCLGTNSTRANWIACAIGLAARLLGANIDCVPSEMKREPPAWLIESVLRQWANPFAIDQPPMSHPVPMSDLLRHPTGLLEGLRQRWPNPILATISVNGKFNNLPRLPYQMANCLSRIGRLLLGAPSELHEH